MSDGVVGAVIGGFLAGGAGVLTVLISHKLELNRAAKENDKKINAFLISIHSEIKILWYLYMEGVGEKVDLLHENPKEPFRWLWPIGQDYFTVFEANAHMIGEIEDSVLREKIIAGYIGAKSLIDQFHFHNSRLNELSEEEKQPDEGQELRHASRSLVLKGMLIDDAKRLRNTHMEVKDIIANSENGLISLLIKATSR